MRKSPTVWVLAAAAASLVLAGCYTQFGTTEEEQPADDITSSESDTVEGEEMVVTEAYEDARYRFYVNVGYPYWTPAFSVGFWDPYPYDPWLWGPPAYWYPYGAYYAPGWYYPPPVAYYPPGYWYGPPVAPYPGGYPAYANRTFGATRGYGSTRTGVGTYRGVPASLGVRAGAVSRVRPTTTSPTRTPATPAVRGRKAASPTTVDRPSSTKSSEVRQRSAGTRSTSTQVRTAPPQGKPKSSGTRQSATPQRVPERQPEDSSVKPRSTDSGGSRSYSPAPSSAPASRPSGSANRGSSSGGGSSAPRSGGRR